MNVKKMVEKTPLMKKFEKENPGKHAIWNGKKTAQFKKWKRHRDAQPTHLKLLLDNILFILFIFTIFIGPILIIQGINLSRLEKYLIFSLFLFTTGIIFIIIPIAILVISILILVYSEIHIPNGLEFLLVVVSYFIELIIFIMIEFITHFYLIVLSFF